MCHGETACGLLAPQMAPFWMPFLRTASLSQGKIAPRGLRLGKEARACGGHKRKVELIKGVIWDLEGHSSYLTWNTTPA